MTDSPPCTPSLYISSDRTQSRDFFSKRAAVDSVKPFAFARFDLVHSLSNSAIGGTWERS